MKLEIFGGKKETEDVLRLKLVIMAGNVCVVALDAKGDEIIGGVIFYIRPDGTGCVAKSVSNKVPIQRTSSGAIKLIGE